MSLTVYPDLEQGTPEWLAARCGIVTASVVGQLISKGAPDALQVECPKCEAATDDACVSLARKVPTPLKTVHDERTAEARYLPPVYQVSDGDMARALTMTLTAERITGHVEPINSSQAMIRGQLDEPFARASYSEHHAPASEVGFMVRQFDGYQLGYSPDGLVGEDGLIEIKSRAQKKHLQTILANEAPSENMAQMQAGLLVSGREWCDYVSFCSGMPLWTKRVYPDPSWFAAIHAAAQAFEQTAEYMITTYNAATANCPPTERLDHFADMEIF